MDGFKFPEFLRLRRKNNSHQYYDFRLLSGIRLLCVLVIVMPCVTLTRAAENSIALTPVESGFPGKQLSLHPSTGLLRFMGTQPGKPIFLNKPPGRESSRAYARAFTEEYGTAFGIEDFSQQLILRKNTGIAGRGDSLRYQQMYNGVPVFAGELVLNLDNRKALLSMNGEIAPSLSLPVTPFLTAKEAKILALEAVAKWRSTGLSSLQTSEPQLMVYDAQLLKPGIQQASLVWAVEVSPVELAPVRELVLVDAHTGSINLHFNQVHEAKDRNTHNAAGTSALPGNLSCSESDNIANCAQGDPDIANAHAFAGDSYDFYASVHGRDGIDNAGSAIVSTVHWFQGGVCPNAFWDGTQMVYCTGMADADDIVGHELTHGVTRSESNLIYYYESGAINESLSDVWGEFIDLTNGAGDDSQASRWLIGEDLVSHGGAIRDMKFPGNFGHPDRMTSPDYHVSHTDRGGVHKNSGVNNKAAYLMTDGDTFNGITVHGIGIAKTAKIYYEAQTNLLTTASEFSDLYLALYQACLNLVGTTGITADDCVQVRNATDAVEMNMGPAGNPGFKPQAGLCPADMEQGDILFSDDMESGSDQWSTGTHPWYTYTHYAKSGVTSIGSPDANQKRDAKVWNSTPVTLSNDAYLHFNHGFGFEYFDTSFFDGGVIEYSIDGSTWHDLATLHDDGQAYGGIISSDWRNPLGGRTGFVGESHGFVSSRYDLAALSGQEFQVRFRMGSDKSVSGPLGWIVDDVSIHRCVADTGPPPDCSGTNVLVQNREFTGEETCQASQSLEANTAVTVKSGASVTFQSGGTTLGPGFSVESGGKLTVEGGL